MAREPSDRPAAASSARTADGPDVAASCACRCSHDAPARRGREPPREPTASAPMGRLSQGWQRCSMRSDSRSLHRWATSHGTMPAYACCRWLLKAWTCCWSTSRAGRSEAPPPRHQGTHERPRFPRLDTRAVTESVSSSAPKSVLTCHIVHQNTTPDHTEIYCGASRLHVQASARTVRTT